MPENIFDFGSLTSTVLAAKDKAITKIADYGLNNAFGGHVLPTLPPYPRNGTVNVNVPAWNGDSDLAIDNELDEVVADIFGTPMCFPLKVRATDSGDDFWTIPIEPIISLSGNVQMLRRNVKKKSAKPGVRGGSIKSIWSLDDYDINIEGVLTRFDEWRYPSENVKKLAAILEKGMVDVQCPLFEWFAISRIAVDKFDFPFTKGEENQAYRIHAWSDDNWELLIEK